MKIYRIALNELRKLVKEGGYWSDKGKISKLDMSKENELGDFMGEVLTGVNDNLVKAETGLVKNITKYAEEHDISEDDVMKKLYGMLKTGEKPDTPHNEFIKKILKWRLGGGWTA